MPANNDKAGSAAQPDPNAQTTEQQPAAANPKTQNPNPGESSTAQPLNRSTSSLMDHLNIPADIQKQIAPKGDVPQSATPPAADGNPDDDRQVAVDPNADPNQASHDPDADPDSQRDPNDPDAVVDPNTDPDADPVGDKLVKIDGELYDPKDPKDRKIIKKHKRIGRLTGERARIEDEANALAAENQQYREYFARLQQGQTDANAAPVPGASGPLARVATEAQLNIEISRAKALREWCDANAEGVTVGEGDKQEFHDPNKIAAYRREADKILTDAPERRDQIRRFTQEQQAYNQAAYTAMPQLFDRSSEEHQLATAVLQELPPQARNHPGINLFLADWVRGFQARQAEQKTPNAERRTPNGGNGNGNRAISDLAFKPRVPLAPHTDITISRGSGPSPQKKVDAAMNEVVQQGGSVESLADAIGTIRQSAGSKRNPRSPVTV